MQASTKGGVNAAAKHLMVGQVIMEKNWNSAGAVLLLHPKQKCCHCSRVPNRQVAKKVIYYNPRDECKTWGEGVYGNVSK